MISVNNKYFLEITREISKKKNKDKPFLFIGAGISIDSGLPSWGKLTERCVSEAFSDEATVAELAKLHNVEKYSIWLIEASIQRLKKLGKLKNDKNYTKFFSKVLWNDDPTAIKPNLSHFLIVMYSIEFNVPIFTLNYDPLLEDAAAKLGKAIPVYLRNEMSNFKYESSIVYLHGKISNKDKIPVAGQFSYYEEFNSKINLAIKKFENLISKNSCLFIGTSLSDHNINRLLFNAKDITKKNKVTHYWFTSQFPQNLFERSLFEEFWDVLRVKPIFCTTPEFSEISALLRRVISANSFKKIFPVDFTVENYNFFSTKYNEVAESIALKKSVGNFDSFEVDLYIDNSVGDKIGVKRVWCSGRNSKEFKEHEAKFKRFYELPGDLDDLTYDHRLNTPLISVEETIDTLKPHYGVRVEENDFNRSNGYKSWAVVTFPIFSNSYGRCEAVFVLKYLNKSNKLTESIIESGALSANYSRDIVKVRKLFEGLFLEWKSGGKNVKKSKSKSSNKVKRR